MQLLQVSLLEFGLNLFDLGLTEPCGSKEASVELIKLDTSRTFPQLCIFQKVKKAILESRIYQISLSYTFLKVLAF